MTAVQQAEELVMILSLRDQISKDLKNAISNLDKMKKTMDNGTKSTKEANSWWKNATGQLKSFNTAIVALGVSSLAAGFGIKSLVDASQQIAQSNAQAQFSTALLGPAAQKAYEQMKPSFGAIGESVMATANQVNEAYGIMSSASGLTTLSTKDLQAAFNVAKVTGVDFTQAAKLVGQALRGDQEPLRALVGPYGYKGLADVEDKAGLAATMNRTSFDKLNYQLSTVKDTLATALTPALNTVLGIFIAIPTPVKEAGIIFFGVVAAITAVTTAVGLLVIAFGALDVVAPWILGIGVAITGIILIIQNWGAIWTWLKGVANTVITAVGSFFDWLGTHVHDIINTMGTFVGGIFSGLGTAANTVVTAIGNFFSGLGDTINKAFTTAYDYVIGKINGIITLINEAIDLANKLTGLHIPGVSSIASSSASTASSVTGTANGATVSASYATGGMAYTPQIASVAETEPEAIIPQSQLDNMRGGQTTVNLYATIADRNSLQDFVRQITPYLQQNNRRGGAASATY